MWSLQWRHNEHGDVSNHRRLDCLLSYLFRRRSKKTPKHRVAGLCEGNSVVTGGFPSQRAFDDVIMRILPFWKNKTKQKQQNKQLETLLLNLNYLTTFQSKVDTYSSLMFNLVDKYVLDTYRQASWGIYDWMTSWSKHKTADAMTYKKLGQYHSGIIISGDRLICHDSWLYHIPWIFHVNFIRVSKYK